MVEHSVAFGHDIIEAIVLISRISCIFKLSQLMKCILHLLMHGLTVINVF